MQIPEANLRNMLNAISQGNHVLNETVRLYMTSEDDCPDCTYDPIRGESVDYNCQTCDGKGSIVSETYQEISASVETEKDFSYHFTEAGRITKGQIFLTVDIKELNEILNVDNEYDLNDYKQMKSFIDRYNYILWKGAKYTVDSYEPGWLQGHLYEIGFTLNLAE